MLLLLDVTTSQQQHLQLTGAAPARQKFDKLTRKVASYNSAKLKLVESFSTVHSPPEYHWIL